MSDKFARFLRHLARGLSRPQGRAAAPRASARLSLEEMGQRITPTISPSVSGFTLGNSFYVADTITSNTTGDTTRLADQTDVVKVVTSDNGGVKVTVTGSAPTTFGGTGTLNINTKDSSGTTASWTLPWDSTRNYAVEIFGGAGNDTLDISGFTNSVDPSFANGQAVPFYLVGGAGNDHLVGGNGNDYLDAGAGSNTVYGKGGNDVIVVGSFDAGTTSLNNYVLAGGGSAHIYLAPNATATIDNSYTQGSNRALIDVKSGATAILIDTHSATDTPPAVTGSGTVDYGASGVGGNQLTQGGAPLTDQYGHLILKSDVVVPSAIDPSTWSSSGVVMV